MKQHDRLRDALRLGRDMDAAYRRMQRILQRLYQGELELIWNELAFLSSDCRILADQARLLHQAISPVRPKRKRRK